MTNSALEKEYKSQRFLGSGKKFWRARYFADEMNHNSLMINDKSGCSRITDHLFSCSFHRQVMGLKGGIGCLLALFAGLLWLECTVSTTYFHLRSLEISLCIINTRQWIILVDGQVVFRWFVVFFSLIYNREFTTLRQIYPQNCQNLRGFWQMF